MDLKDLDARLLPQLAQRLRALLDRADRRRTAAGQSLVGGPLPGRRGPLRRLDDRFAARGPLALLADVPQLGVLIVAVVFLTGAGVALARSGPESVQQRQEQQQEAALPLSLGPAPGTDIDPFLAQARDRAVALSRRDPDATYLALVSLSGELSPEDAQRLLDGSTLTAKRAYVRAPVPAPRPEILPVDLSGDLAADLTTVFAATAQRKATEQRELLSQAATLTPGTDDAAKKQFEADARTAGLEAAAYRTPCACVIALVVQGRAAELAELPSLPAVRGVELAPHGADLAALDVMPLAPSTTGTVPVPPAGS